MTRLVHATVITLVALVTAHADEPAKGRLSGLDQMNVRLKCNRGAEDAGLDREGRERLASKIGEALTAAKVKLAKPGKQTSELVVRINASPPKSGETLYLVKVELHELVKIDRIETPQLAITWRKATRVNVESNRTVVDSIQNAVMADIATFAKQWRKDNGLPDEEDKPV